MMRANLLILALRAALALLLAVPAAAQQSPFAPRVLVNGSAVTHYEVEQRRAFLQLLRAPGDLDEAAVQALIEDRLRMQEAEKLGIELSERQIMAGMEEFASRANLTVEQFVEAIGAGGVAPETFRDFVHAGLAWREVVRARFAGSVTISEAEIDRALSTASQRGAGTRVLISEMIIPAPPQSAEAAQALAARLSATLGGEGAFAAAARQHSASGTAGRGGRLDWIPLANLPPQLRPLILGLAPGQVSPPVPLPNAVGLFLLRAIDEGGPVTEADATLDYAQFLIPGGRSAAALEEAARIRAKVDACNDLYAVAKGLPPERLTRETRRLSEIPSDIALELARLDANESSTALTRGDALVFLMLCSRRAMPAMDAGLGVAPPPSAEPEPAPDATTEPTTEAAAGAPASGLGEAPLGRNAIRNQLSNERLGALSDSYLADLQANAIIRYP